MPMDLVLIDTCIWVPFFNRPPSAEKRGVEALLDADQAALIGPLLAEILQGFRRDDRADWVASYSGGCIGWRFSGTIGVRQQASGDGWQFADTVCRLLTWLLLRLPCEPIPPSIRPILTSTWSPD